MPSSTTLYTSPGNAGNVASRNFTTLYSGSGSINPTQPYGNANVVGLLAASTDGANTIGVISATGNIISDAFFIGNGSQLTGIVASSVNANALTGNTLSPNVLFSSLTSVGTLSNLSVSGTVTAGTFAGNGSQLTNIPGANVTGTVANATFATTAGSATTAVTVTGNAQANITSVGVLTSLSSTGNITAPYFLGNVIGNITGNIVVGGANTEVLVNNNGNIGPSPGLTFNNASNVLNTSGSVTAVGNIQGNYFLGNGSQLTGLPVQYGNANVATFLANFGSNSISTSGNVTAGYFAGNGSLLSNITGANVTGTVANAAFATTAGTATTVTGNAQANITSVGVLTSLSVTGTTTSGNILTAGQVSATGNITGNYILGNGSQLTGLPATYGNANVVSLMAAFGSNTISTSGNVTAGNLALSGGMQITGSIVNSAAVNKQVAFLGAGAISTGQVKFGTGSALLDGTANTFIQTAASGANLLFTTSDWTIEMFVYPTANIVNPTVFYDIGEVGSSGDRAPQIGWSSGNLIYAATNVDLISAAATVTANTWNHIAAARSSGNTKLYLNGVQVGSTYADTINYNEGGAGNLRVGSSTLTASGAAQFIGYVDEVRISNGIGRYTGSTYTVPVNPFSADTDTALLLHCDGANGSTVILDSSSTSDVTVDDNLVVTGDITFSGLLYGDGSQLTNITAATATTAVTVTGNAQANITSVGTLSSLSVSGNTTSGNILTAGIVSATGNITGNYILGNGSQLTGITTSAGGSNTQIQYNNGGAFAGNTAMTFNNTTGRVQLGNITTLGSIINTANTWVDTTAASISPSTIIIGNGYSGNYTTTYLTNNQRNTRLSLLDLLTATDNGARKTELASTVYYDLNGVTTYGNANVNSRLQGLTSEVYIQNGNTVQTSPFIARSGSFVLQAGQSANVGNANLATAGSIQSFISVANGSRIGNALGIYSSSSGNTAQGALMPTAMLFVSAPNHQPGSGAVDVGNIFNYYTPGSVNNFGLASGNATRVANYWNIYNEDNANKNRLGALTQYQESSYSLSSSAGSVVVNKANSQVQYYTVSEAATMSFTGFITVANIPTGGGVPTAVNRYQTDTVTVIVQQDSTGRTITMPTGTGYKYAGGTNTVPATANAISMISITAYYDPGTSATAYLTTISPAFT